MIDTITHSGKGAVKEETQKSKILLMNTYAPIDKFLKRVKYRDSGNYEKIPAFTVGINGKVYKHYNPKFYSKILGSQMLDKYVIPIALENVGWLEKDIIANKYYDWLGDIYKEENGIVEITWRGHTFWSPYSEAQLDALALLSVKLCKNHNIPLRFIGENVKVDNINNFTGIVSRSNFFTEVADISPAFSINFFVKKLEEYGKQLL